MALEFDWITLTELGSSPHVEGKQSGLVSIMLDAGFDQFFPTVRADVLVERRPDIPWSEIEDQARAYAIDVLRAAISALEEGSIEDLRSRAKARREKRERESDAKFQESLTAAFQTKQV